MQFIQVSILVFFVLIKFIHDHSCFKPFLFAVFCCCLLFSFCINNFILSIIRINLAHQIKQSDVFLCQKFQSDPGYLSPWSTLSVGSFIDITHLVIPNSDARKKVFLFQPHIHLIMKTGCVLKYTYGFKDAAFYSGLHG